MKAIIPIAGAGTKLRPHSYSQPKALIPLAGKTVLSIIIDQLKEANVNEFIFIVGYMGDKIQDYVKNKYPELREGMKAIATSLFNEGVNAYSSHSYEAVFTNFNAYYETMKNKEVEAYMLGIFKTNNNSPVSVKRLTRMFVPNPKKAFQSPGTQSFGLKEVFIFSDFLDMVDYKRCQFSRARKGCQRSR